MNFKTKMVIGTALYFVVYNQEALYVTWVTGVEPAVGLTTVAAVCFGEFGFLHALEKYNIMKDARRLRKLEEGLKYVRTTDGTYQGVDNSNQRSTRDTVDGSAEPDYQMAERP